MVNPGDQDRGHFARVEKVLGGEMVRVKMETGTSRSTCKVYHRSKLRHLPGELGDD